VRCWKTVGSMTDRLPSPHSTTAVILNWDTAELTIRAARALMADGLAARRIVVVDNGSSDASMQRLQAELEECILVRLDENLGYGRAANLGARALAGDAYLFIDNDAFVHGSGVLDRMLRVLAERPSVGVVAPKALHTDLTLQPTVAALQTPLVALVRASGLSRLVPDRWQPLWSTHWAHDVSREVQGVAGPAILVRGEVWTRLSGFDEGLHMEAEDLDLCFRTRAAGWQVWFAADAEFVHVGSAATRNRYTTTERAEIVGKAEGRMIRRNLPGRKGRLAVSIIWCGVGMRYLVKRVMGQRTDAATLRAAMRGYFKP
jgi:N-acetylglucosaminyl-diphospho-decaprenol L-rhamnosyltransferase